MKHAIRWIVANCKFAAPIQPKTPVSAISKPMHGPWYLAYIKPNWVIKAYPIPHDNEYSILHPDLWDMIAPDIAAKNGIKDQATISRIKSMCYGMPRGRIVYRPTDPQTGKPAAQPFLFCYSNDIKAIGINFEIIKRGVLGKFGLEEAYKAGKVRFVADEHEMMEPVEYKRLISILKNPTTTNPDNQPLQQGLTKKDKGEMVKQRVDREIYDAPWKNRTGD